MTDYSQPDLESEYLPYKNVKLAATVAMNTPYHPYSDISPTHPPSPDNNNYPPLSGGGYHNGHIGVHTPQMTQMPDDVSPEYHHQNHHSNHHHHQHHQMNNNNNNNNNNNSPIKHCAGCGEKISDRFLLHALDRYWHNSCLKCNCCGAMLADMGSSCYTRRGLILCKKDYSSMFGSSGTCSGCGQTIPPNELVAKAMSPLNQQTTNLDNQKSSQSNLYLFHLKCFLCTKCGAHLRPGDRYTMLAGSLVCEQDWHKIIKNNPGNGGAVGGPIGPSGSTTTTNGTATTVRKGKVGRPRRTKE